jgi:hypothetical protein
MKPTLMSNDFNPLELAIFAWLKKTDAHRQLSAQLDSAKLVKRDWTKVGFFVRFEVSKELDPIDPDDFGAGWPIDGPGLKSEAIHYGGDSLIWGTNGYLDCLELYAFGDYFNEEVEDFELITSDRGNSISK